METSTNNAIKIRINFLQFSTRQTFIINICNAIYIFANR
ncbi:hypothetical protein M085_4186 [Bacteroides fragilis str. 3986 N(B)19]|nr:hypothetical protein M085_4186 [Bacteroides fragilis str. 3986 N(B)19]